MSFFDGKKNTKNLTYELILHDRCIRTDIHRYVWNGEREKCNCVLYQTAEQGVTLTRATLLAPVDTDIYIHLNVLKCFVITPDHSAAGFYFGDFYRM